MTYQASEKPNKAGVATPVSDKVDIKPKLVRRDFYYKGHYMLIKGTIHQ
jgi:NADH/NAD ratio-sensing transcriptional regulator Rex